MPSGSSGRKVVVVGGGIAGLSTAFLLKNKAKQYNLGLDLMVLEARPYAGGSTRTDIIDGYTCEWGPNGFLDNEPRTMELVKMLGIEDRLVRADEASSRRFIYHSGRMREVAMNPLKFIKSDIVSFPTKLRMAMEYFVPAKKNGNDETVYSFGRRRLGRGFAKYLLDPMVSGVFAGDTRQLSLKAVFPKMVEMESEYGGLFKAMIAKQKEAKKNGGRVGGPSGPSGVLHTFKYGMGELTSTLAGKLKTELKMSSPVSSIEYSDNVFRIATPDEIIEADDVVLASPSYETSKMINGINGEVARSLGEIYFAPVDVVCHGYRSGDLGKSVNGFGVLAPRSEGIRSLGSLWSDSIFPGQAPEGHHLLRTILGGAYDPDIINLDDKQLDETAREDLSRIMGIKQDPDFARIFRHPRGIPQYTVGHLNRVALTEKMESDLPGIYFTGVSYRGVSVNGCIKDAFRVAEDIFEKDKRR